MSEAKIIEERIAMHLISNIENQIQIVSKTYGMSIKNN